MGRKCIIKDCRTNYRVTNKEKKNEIIRETLKTFSFPNKTKHAKERERWIKSIPFWKKEEIEEMKTPVICEKHWPAGFAEMIPINGLDANFLFEQVNHVVDLIKDTSGE